ncbi:hypothetical protein FACS1894188_09170 [Clostridia bacterium]|nr:hypothetical protein FACS1894188_09170 [Clostridia bacterium]
MMLRQEKPITIVYSSATKQCAEFLHGLIGELTNQVVPVNAVVIDQKTYVSYHPENKNAAQKIIYIIGNFPESETLSKNIMKWQFDKFGVRYGWLGNKAGIYFDPKSLSEREFAEMARCADKQFEVNMRDKVNKVGLDFGYNLERSFNPLDGGLAQVSGGAIASVVVGWISWITGKTVLDTVLNMDKLNVIQIAEQQKKFAVLHFLFLGIGDFLGMNDLEVKNIWK